MFRTTRVCLAAARLGATNLDYDVPFIPVVTVTSPSGTLLPGGSPPTAREP